MDRLLLITAVASAVGFLAVRWPVEASLGLYAFLLPFDTVLLAGETGGIHIHITWFVAVAACGTLLFTGLTSRGFVRPPRAAIWWILFVLWVVMSSAWAINLKAATFRLPVVGLVLLLYIVAVSFRATEKELSTVVWMVILGGCTAAAISLYEFAQGAYWTLEGAEEVDAFDKLDLSGRASLALGGRLTNPNTLAASLILPLALSIGLFLSSRTWRSRLPPMVSIALTGACILTAMSRGTLIAVAVVLLVFLWRSRANWRVLVPLTVMAGTVLAMPAGFFTRFQETLEDRGAGRFDIWEAGTQAFKHYGLFGVGFDCFPTVFNKYVYVIIHYVGAPRGPHNSYLGTAVELGVVGLVLLLAIIADHFLTAAKVLRVEKYEPSRMRLISYEAACWGLLVNAFTQDMLWEEYFWFAWILLIMAARARQASQYQPCRI